MWAGIGWAYKQKDWSNRNFQFCPPFKIGCASFLSPGSSWYMSFQFFFLGQLTVGNFSFNNFGSLVRFKFFTDKPKFSKRTFGLLKLYLALPYNPKPNLILKKPKPPSPSQTIAIDVTRFKKKRKSKLLLLLVACSVPYHSAIIVTHNLMLSLNLFPVTKVISCVYLIFCSVRLLWW